MTATMRVATFNVRTGWAFDGRHSWPLRWRAAAAAAAVLAPDVLALQEVHGWQLGPLRRALPGHEAVGDGRNRLRRGERCTVLAGAAVEVLGHRTRWFGDDPDRPGSRLGRASHPRVATIADLRLRTTGTRFTAVSTHLDQRHADNRLRSVEQLLGWLDADVPAVVLGDLNTDPDTPELRRLEAAGFRSALPQGAGGTEHRFTGRTDGRRIDHVLVRGPWEVGRAGVAVIRPRGRLPSDHWPVVAELHLG